MDAEWIYRPVPKWALKLIAVGGLALILTGVAEYAITGAALIIVGVIGIIRS